MLLRLRHHPKTAHHALEVGARAALVVGAAQARHALSGTLDNSCPMHRTTDYYRNDPNTPFYVANFTGPVPRHACAAPALRHLSMPRTTGIGARALKHTPTDVEGGVTDTFRHRRAAYGVLADEAPPVACSSRLSSKPPSATPSAIARTL